MLSWKPETRTKYQHQLQAWVFPSYLHHQARTSLLKEYQRSLYRSNKAKDWKPYLFYHTKQRPDRTNQLADAKHARAHRNARVLLAACSYYCTRPLYHLVKSFFWTLESQFMFHYFSSQPWWQGCLVDLNWPVDLLYECPAGEEADWACIICEWKERGKAGRDIPVRIKNKKEISALYPIYSTVPASPPNCSFVTK